MFDFAQSSLDQVETEDVPQLAENELHEGPVSVIGQTVDVPQLGEHEVYEGSVPVGEPTENLPQMEEHELQEGPAAVGEQLEVAPDFLMNEPKWLIPDFARVETVYLQWLQNMHFRRTVDYY